MPFLSSEQKNPNLAGFKSAPKLPWIALGVAVVALLVLGGLFWRNQHQLNKLKSDIAKQQNDPANKALQESKELIAKVGKLIVLPANEQPTTATVTDLEKLKGQPFFEKAQLGDKVLIYSQAKQAILYRPSTNQIVELAPLIDGTNTPANPTNSAPPSNP